MFQLYFKRCQYIKIKIKPTCFNCTLRDVNILKLKLNQHVSTVLKEMSIH
jgi:hypothetical protein